MTLTRNEKGFAVGSGDHTYQVYVENGKVAFCDCPGFKFRKGPIADRPHCKHMIEAESSLAEGRFIRGTPTPVSPTKKAADRKPADAIMQAFEAGLRGH